MMIKIMFCPLWVRLKFRDVVKLTFFLIFLITPTSNDGYQNYSKNLNHENLLLVTTTKPEEDLSTYEFNDDQPISVLFTTNVSDRTTPDSILMLPISSTTDSIDSETYFKNIFKTAGFNQTNSLREFLKYIKALGRKSEITAIARTSPDSISDCSQVDIPSSYTIKKSDSNSASVSSTCEMPCKINASLCPNDLTFLEPNFCFKILQNVNYYTKCPYKNYIPFHYLPDGAIKSLNLSSTEIWFRANRNTTKTCFNSFQWTDLCGCFGEDHYQRTQNCTFGCITRRGVSPGWGSSCYENHTHLCLYDISQYKDGYCKNYFRDFESCIWSHFDYDKGTCYCKINTLQNSCQKLAEPKEPFQTQRLLKWMSSSTPCLFGLEKENGNRFVWKSSKEIVDYSYWTDTSCEYNNGAINYSGWSLVKENTSSCSICEFSIPRTNIELQLKYFEFVNKLYLFISNSSIRITNIYCYYDAINDRFFKQINILSRTDENRKCEIQMADFPSQHWCKVIQFPDNKVVQSNTIITYDRTKEYGYEYAIHISINTSDIDYVRRNEHVSLCQLLHKEILRKCSNSVISLRPIKILDNPQKIMELKLLLHLTTKKTSRNQTDDFHLMLEILENYQVENVNIFKFLSSEVCLSTTSKSLDSQDLVWPETRIGKTAVPSNLRCLDENNNLKPVIRKCDGNFMEGARWLNPEGNCSSDGFNKHSETTRQLYELMTKVEINNEDITKLRQMTENHGTQIPSDVYMISNILKKVSKEHNIEQERLQTYEIINNMMNYRKSVLRDAQNKLNATDDILNTLDNWLNLDIKNFNHPNFIFRTIDLTGIIGISLHRIYNASGSYNIILWAIGTSLENMLKREDLEIALFFSTETIDEINKAIKSLNVFVVMFYTNALFNEPEENKTEKQLKSEIVSISIPGFGDYLKHPIKIFHKYLHNSTEKMCSFWRYGWDDLMMPVQGRWDEQGKKPLIYKNFEVCDISHPGHFGLISEGLEEEKENYSDICLSTTSLSLDNQTLVWPETRIGMTVVPSNLLCLDKNNKFKPVMRKCDAGEQGGGRWLNPEGNCFSDDSEYSETTKKLFALMNKTTIDDEAVTTLLQITENHDTEASIDVYFISSILKKIPKTGNKMDVYKIINNMMNYGSSVLKHSQVTLNATDDILYTLDTWLNRDIIQTKVTLPNIIFRIADLTEVIGMSLHKINNTSNSFESYDLVPWNKNILSLETIQYKNFEAAVLFTEEAIDEIDHAVEAKQSLKLIVLMFYTNALFNEPEGNETEKQLKNKIVTISVPGFSSHLNNSIKLIYNFSDTYTEKICSFWKYGWDDSMVSAHGKWDEKGDEPVSYKKFDVCNFFHMTHFGLLLGGFQNEIFSPKRKFLLKLVTATGLGLSLAGILPIFITFAMFKVWRARSSNIILINFCFVITLQTVVMVVMDSINEDGVVCKLMAAVLHYLVLSEFFWMVAIGFLQYRRFVHVLKPPYENVIFKCCFIGWVLPLLPVFIIACISLDNYGINESKFCYVIGTYNILFGLYLPIMVILIINIYIFVLIFMCISKTSLKSEADGGTKNYKLKIYLALLLFFILGLTWIFGLLGIFTSEITFTYLFCATATLRGLIIFFYFIVMNKESVLMWKRRIHHYMLYLHTRLYTVNND